MAQEFSSLYFIGGPHHDPGPMQGLCEHRTDIGILEGPAQDLTFDVGIRTRHRYEQPVILFGTGPAWTRHQRTAASEGPSQEHDEESDHGECDQRPEQERRARESHLVIVEHRGPICQLRPNRCDV